MKYKKNSYISSIILLTTSIIYHIIVFKKSLFSISLILVAFTSCKHHSRFDKWFINDIYRLLDWLAIIIFSIIYSIKYY